MRKLIVLPILATITLTGCASLQGDFEYRQVDATVNSSKLVHKVCMPENAINNKEYYHPDIQRSDFFNSHEFSSKNERFLCRYGVYETNVRFNNPMNNRAVRGTILTRERYQRDTVIPIYHKYRL